MALSPRAIFMAAVSVESLAGVDVPWAFTYETSAGEMSASASANVMARAAPVPPGRGRVM